MTRLDTPAHEEDEMKIQVKPVWWWISVLCFASGLAILLKFLSEYFGVFQ